VNSGNQTSVLLFDGVCNLCIGVVKFTIKRDTKEKIRFAALQSESGQALLKKFGLATNDFDSFVFITGDKYYLRSSAGLYVLKELGGVWKLFYGFIIIPRPVRDFIYKIVAKIRYRIFGKQDNCMVPSPEIKRRFL
jgi:predicted DCC family thiol-disulfide oxidoreductase YuxK